MQVKATIGNSSAKSAGCSPASGSPARARWLASIMASNRRIACSVVKKVRAAPAGSFHPVSAASCSADSRNCFWPGDEEINERAEEMEEEDYQNPQDLFRIAQSFIGDGMDEHPDPEHSRLNGKGAT